MKNEAAHQFLFYTPSLETKAKTVDLERDDHHHLTRVLRMKVGETAYAGNGRGMIAKCEVAEIHRNRTILRVTKVVPPQKSACVATLAMACTKKDAFETIVKQCTELGVTRFVPVAADRSHGTVYSPAFIRRLGRIAVSAMKQSFRATLPPIDGVIDMNALIDSFKDYDHVVVGDSDGEPLEAAGRGSVLVVVGPEAGFSKAERTLLRESGATLCAISSQRLRSETAAAAMTAILLAPRS